MATVISERYLKVKSLIDDASKRSERSKDRLTLVGVTKTLPAEMVVDGFKAGLRHVGENRLEGALEKKQEVERSLGKELADKLTWHFIGHIQSRKARKILELFDYIQSIDSLKLLKKVDTISAELGKKTKALLQINISGAESQGGIPLDEMGNAIREAEALENVQVEGLMAIGPNTRDQQVIRKAYKDFYSQVEKYKSQHDVELSELSMGMSGDYEIAIEEGATIVRVGTAIFGPRKL